MISVNLRKLSLRERSQGVRREIKGRQRLCKDKASNEKAAVVCGNEEV